MALSENRRATNAGGTAGRDECAMNERERIRSSRLLCNRLLGGERRPWRLSERCRPRCCCSHGRGARRRGAAGRCAPWAASDSRSLGCAAGLPRLRSRRWASRCAPQPGCPPIGTRLSRCAASHGPQRSATAWRERVSLPHSRTHAGHPRLRAERCLKLAARSPTGGVRVHRGCLETARARYGASRAGQARCGRLLLLGPRTVRESVLSTIFVTSVVSGELWRGAWLPNGTNGR